MQGRFRKALKLRGSAMRNLRIRLVYMKSPEQVCPYRKKCGGCQLQNLSYPEQLRFKMAKEIRLLGRFHRISPIIAMENPYHYRAKVQAAFTKRSGRIISGVYQSSTHNIVEVENCLIEDEKADEIIATIRTLLKSFKLKAFNDREMTGFLRHVMVRRSFSTGQIMVVLVTFTREFPSCRSFVNALVSRHEEITTVVQSVNSRYTSMVLGDEIKVLYGKGYIEDELCGCIFRISPSSFYQVNPVQTVPLYKTAIDQLGLDGTQTVIDAYCGTGTIGIIAAKKAGRVIGTEINAEAISSAKQNAKLNGCGNAEFYAADAGEFLKGFAQSGQKADAVIMDPPRAGASKEFLKALVQIKPEKISYVSCCPETLARDLGYLTKGGYRVRSIQPVDMFPHTEHIETVVLLDRKIVNDKNVEYMHVDY